VPRLDTVCSVRPRTGPATPLLGALVRRLRDIVSAAFLLTAGLVHADNGIEMASFDVARDHTGVYLSFATRFELPRGVEEALLKGVPLHFVADVEIYRSRWWWFNPRVAEAMRTWRLAWQPLTRSWRVSFGGLNQNYETLEGALGALRGVWRWKIAEPGQIDEGAQHTIEFRYRLDTAQLPRPLQIGVAGQSDWSLAIERSAALR